MEGVGKKSRYALDALLKKRCWDLDVASAELSEARQVVDQRAQETSLIGQSIDELERELRLAWSDGAEIDPARHSVLSAYLDDRRQMLKLKLSELRKAEEEFEQTRHRLYRIKQGVMVLEKHKDGKEKEQAREAQRSAQKQTDDMWLQRRQDEQVGWD